MLSVTRSTGNTSPLQRRKVLAAGAWAGAAAMISRTANAIIPQVHRRGLRIEANEQAHVHRPAMQAFAFDLSDVKLLDGPFKDCQQRDAAWLMSMEPDRLLAPVLLEAGLKPKGPQYGGWESPGSGVASHSLGHHLSAVSMLWAATGEPKFKDRIAYMVAEMARAQAANGDGYAAGIPGSKAIWKRVLAGDINVGNPKSRYSFSLNGMWSPWYTIHKLLAGLRDSWLYCQNHQAREVLIKFSNWCGQFPRKLSQAQMQTMLISEQGGMNEVLADIYAITGERKYLTMAEAFNEHSQLDPLMQRKDILSGVHSNQYIPRVIGIARQYELTGKKKYRTGAEFFWEDVAFWRTFVTGGHGDYENFFPIGDSAKNLTGHAAETCCIYNMLKLTGHLMCWHPNRMAYADYAERCLFNTILASQDPDGGMVTYYMSLKPGHFKTFSTPFNSFWCCCGTGVENHAKYGKQIYYHDGKDNLWLTVIIASALQWKACGMHIRQDTDFPKNNHVRLTITCDKPVTAAIHLRHPYWATEGMLVTLNGKQTKTDSKAGSYLVLRRKWKTGDVVDLYVSMPLRIEAMKNSPDHIAILHGPIVLAGDLGNADMTKPIPYADGNQSEFADLPDPEIVPDLIVGDKPVAQWVTPEPTDPTCFHTHGAGRPEDVKLIPFYTAQHTRYTVYWRNVTREQWQQQQKKLQARKQFEQELAARTVDHLQPGIPRSEKPHLVRFANSNTGTVAGISWRDASNGGYISFRLKVLPNEPMELMLAFWGSDAGGRVFDILVNNQKIATESLHAAHPDRVFHIEYKLPQNLTAGKHFIRVKLQAHPGMMAGGLFGARTLLRQP